MKYTSSYDIVKDIIEKLGGDSTIKFSSVYQQAKYIAEDLMGAPTKDWASVYQILLYIYHNFTPPVPPKPEWDYEGLTFVALEDSAIALNNFGTNTGSTKPNVLYTLDGNNWDTWDGSEIVLNAGDKIGMRSTSFSRGEANYSNFAIVGNIELSGKLQSMYSDDLTVNKPVPTWCFWKAFADCQGVKDASGLIAATGDVATYAYDAMFIRCENLRKGFDLDVDTVNRQGLAAVYKNCSSLEVTPTINFKSLKGFGGDGIQFFGMFAGCVSLVEGIRVNDFTAAGTDGNHAFREAYSGCTGLNHIVFLKRTIPTTGGMFQNWVSGVAPTGTFVQDINASWSIGVNGIPTGWVIVYYDETDNTYWLGQDRTRQCDEYGNLLWNYEGLTFTALEDSAIAMNNYGDNAPNIQYSLDSVNWSDWDESEIQLAAGDKIGFRADGITKTTASTVYSSFVTQGNLTVEGDITSLVDNGTMTSTAYPNGYNFRRLFYQCEAITDFTKLDMSRLKPINRSFIAMFDGCNNMLYPPKLYTGNGALSTFTYNATFVRCHGLLEMPELSCMNLGDDCYQYMFSECTALTEMKPLPATTLKSGCYSYMFNGCTALNKVSDLPAATTALRCYQNMFVGCTSLEESPVIYAVSNGNTQAMANMFDGCNKLKKITTYFTSFGSTTNSNWVRNVAATGDYYNLGNAPVSYGVNRMPTNWTVHSEL